MASYAVLRIFGKPAWVLNEAIRTLYGKESNIICIKYIIMIIVMIYASQLYLKQYKLFILDIKTGKLNEILAINEQSAQIFSRCFHMALPVHRVSVTLDSCYQSITCIKCYFSCEIIILFAIIMFNNSFSKL